ncbi:MAG: hypothetical protein UFA98_02400 [Ruminococcus sp.]|nr:hypothetical protein [Ruminococcus sp.]
MKLFEKIVNVISDYNVSVEVKKHELNIINRDNDNVLHVYEDMFLSQDKKESFSEYIVEFSTQHRHFEYDSEDEITEYILLILNDKVLPLEFYMDGKRRFGGETNSDELDDLSVSSLSKHYGCTSEYLISFDYEIHSWSGKYDTGLRKVSDLKP